jgi:hypothetical protein
MISSGYFVVTKEKLSTMSMTIAGQFLWEMFNFGGRIGRNEYYHWMNWLLNREVTFNAIR